ncbi:NADPH-dependent FMN reductase [Streptomyces sp. CA-111067]|uniref:NADPH-dependent FMN reductase n=1 Tax=Streptomyces sp. CA-111067 TaxID=3240046 RepID=UPI003D986540
MADHSAAPLRVAVIVGSTREGRSGPVVAGWVAGHARQHGEMDVDLIDLAAHPLPTVLPAFGTMPSDETIGRLRAVTPRLQAADAFVVVTPEYNHSFPAPLKNLIDWHNQQWHAKPVAFVSYGGVSGGLRAVEALRLVFAEVHAVTIRNTVSFSHHGDKFDGEGRAVDPDSDTAAKALLDQLAWWAHATRDAKSARPYTG